MRGFASILSLFCNEYNKFNKTGAHMLDSIHQTTRRLLFNRALGLKTLKYFVIIYAPLLWASLHNVTKSVNH